MGADLLRDQPAGALPKLAPKQELIEAQSVSRRCGPRFSKRRKQMTYSKILNHGCRIQLIPPLESFETDSPLPLSSTDKLLKSQMRPRPLLARFGSFQTRRFQVCSL